MHDLVHDLLCVYIVLAGYSNCSNHPFLVFVLPCVHVLNDTLVYVCAKHLMS